MKSIGQRISIIVALSVFSVFVIGLLSLQPRVETSVRAQDKSHSSIPKPTPVFDQEEAIAKLRQQIKGREKEPAGEVFKNVQNFKDVSAGRLLAIMKFGYARSLGVNCAHCHTQDNWASEEKPAKQIARDMHKMVRKINGELLNNIGGLSERKAIINCTTCHRGQVKPALNLPRPKSPPPKISKPIIRTPESLAPPKMSSKESTKIEAKKPTV